MTVRELIDKLLDCNLNGTVSFVGKVSADNETGYLDVDIDVNEVTNYDCWVKLSA